MGNSTLVVYCEDLAFNFDKNESEMKRDFSFYSNYNSVNGTYTKGFYEAQYKLVKEQEQQIEAFKKTTNGKWTITNLYKTIGSMLLIGNVTIGT